MCSDRGGYFLIIGHRYPKKINAKKEYRVETEVQRSWLQLHNKHSVDNVSTIKCEVN